MSKMTYTDGSDTIWGICTCGQTGCICSSVKYYPRENTIKKYFDEFAEEDIKMAEGGLPEFKKLLEQEDGNDTPVL